MTGFSSFRDSFNAQWSALWKSAHLTFVEQWNYILSSLQSGINSAISSLNMLVRAANSLSGLTGVSYHYVSSIYVQRIPIPRLAAGAVIPPNREFLAVLGDQKQGNNYEVPDAKLRQLLREELSTFDGKSEAVLMLDRDVLGKVVYKLNKSESKRIGVNLAGV